MNIVMLFSYCINTLITLSLMVYRAIFKPFVSMLSVLFLCLQHWICKTKTVIYLTSKRDAGINLASAGKHLHIILSCVFADILGSVFLGRNQY